MHYIPESEIDSILRVANGLINNQIIEHNEHDHPQKISRKYVKMSRKNHNERYINKKIRGYFRKWLEKDNNINMEKSNLSSVNKNMTSHYEDYYSALHDQELAKKYLKNKHDRDDGRQPICNNKCRLCMANIEDVAHIISGCPNMSSRYYLTVGHDALPKYLFQAYIKKSNPGVTFKDNGHTNSCIKSANINTGGTSRLKLLQKYHATNQM